MKRLIALSLSIAFALIMGCSTAPKPLPSGAYAPADAAINETLAAAHGALLQYQQDAVNKVHTPTDQEKATVNKLIDAVNVADASYQSYHKALATNPAAPQPAELTAALAAVQTALPAVESLLGGK
jgi:hypothetical protein